MSAGVLLVCLSPDYAVRGDLQTLDGYQSRSLLCELLILLPGGRGEVLVAQLHPGPELFVQLLHRVLRLGQAGLSGVHQDQGLGQSGGGQVSRRYQ